LSKKKLFISIFLLALAIIVSYSQYDTIMLQNIETTRSHELNTFFTIFTHFGSYRFLVPFGLIIFFGFKKKTFRIPLSIGVLFASIFNTAIKYIVARPRPNIAPLMEYTSYSFPSGHTMVNAVFMYFVYKYFFDQNKRVIPIVLTYSLLMAYSRLYLGVHYPSDIIGGYSAAFGFIVIFEHCFEKKVKINERI